MAGTSPAVDARMRGSSMINLPAGLLKMARHDIEEQQLRVCGFSEGHTGMPMLLRALRFYPQVLSLYVGFDNGDFFMVSHIAGAGRAPLRIALEAPEKEGRTLS